MTFDERKFIARVTKANVEELAQILSHPSADEERVLRIHLGNDRYERMHQMAVEQAGVSRDLVPFKGNVVVLHGIMGGELSILNSPTSKDLIWLSYWRLFRGWAERLRLNDDGITGRYDISATGIMKDYYGEVLLKLRKQNWNVEAFWYDWRKDLKLSADQLNERIREWFGNDSPVHLVAHSMGGLVACTFIKKYPARWKSMWDSKSNGQAGGRLVMLGTPTYGSFIIPQVITGLEPVVRKLSFLDCPHGREGVLKIINTFPGSLQMLPSPFIMKPMEELYKAATYGKLSLSQQHLDNARQHHQFVSDVTDDERMIYIAGYNRKTPGNILNMSRLDSSNSYEVTKLGDGRVTHKLGIPQKNGGQPIRRVYYIEETHSDLLKNRTVIDLMDGLISSGRTDKLRESVPSDVRAVGAEDKEALRRELAIEQDEEVERFAELVARLKQTHRGRAAAEIVTEDEQRVRESLTRGFMGEGEEARTGTALPGQTFQPVPLEVRLAWAYIEDVGEENERAGGSGKRRDLPVDAIAVGHYQGVGRPLMAELAIDKAISLEFHNKKYTSGDQIPDAERVLTLYADRGIIRGALGQPFFINDPRSRSGRIIALAGMGEPGRFGAPELVVLARELGWSLGRIKKRHLATVLIGSGQGNLEAREAIAAWLRGLRAALTGSAHDKDFRLQRITFVENDPWKVEEIQAAIREFAAEEEANKEKQQLQIKYEELDLETIKNRKGQTLKERLREAEREQFLAFQRRQRQKPGSQVNKSQSLIPARLTLSLEGKKYRYGAITEIASVPERDIPLDPSLVMEANDRIPTLSSTDEQLEWGRYMENILLPDDLRPVFSTNAPVVMMLDSTTARIHWEMIAQPDLSGSAGRSDITGATQTTSNPFDSFLGTSRGFTRQLRAAFAPPPEPPPPPRRILRVLVVADPWAEKPLPGARQEGEEVADLFEAFNTVWSQTQHRVEVVRLIGPEAATRNEVLFHLMRRGPYDILHYAGHCMYDREEPSSSGWLFKGGERLSANELNRIDRIPKFVFSNACESGITPDRNVDPGSRTSELAPSFAESFFARGVSNFVCTAWYVNDAAAREFALRLYSGLLGISLPKSSGHDEYGQQPPLRMHVAMHDARRAVANLPYGAGTRTWGAYQHYGNPYLQFFDNQSLSGRSQTGDETKPEATRPATAAKENTSKASRKNSKKSSKKSIKTKTRAASTKPKAASKKKSPARRSKKKRG
ncbi:MAG TPA: CHAT domain-containing protein [Pyrinomonadaceae bacterium]|nr:CHAT domain-containing protein [Pyrinomonadaceae bacterium]